MPPTIKPLLPGRLPIQHGHLPIPCFDKAVAAQTYFTSAADKLMPLMETIAARTSAQLRLVSARGRQSCCRADNCLDRQRIKLMLLTTTKAVKLICQCSQASAKTTDDKATAMDDLPIKLTAKK
jgi:hypothetical protein